MPRGTLIKDLEDNILADLTEPEQTFLAAKGGAGGRGNINFASSKNQVPHKATEGKPGEDKVFKLELKLMADVGLVGFPNAGKSSLVNKISSAHPKVGDYPFTTLEPILGIVQLNQSRSFVIADIPGLIEGAAEGKGLGHTFLKHIERTHTLLFMIDAFGEDPWTQFETLRKELKNFHPKLAEKPYVIALNKMDLNPENVLDKFEANGEKAYPISAIVGNGLPELLKEVEKYLPEPYKGKGSHDGSW